MKVEIRNFTYCYNNNIVLDDINLKIDNGDFIALLGHNGSGKTTLIKAILKENKVSNNKIFLNDIDVNYFDDWNNIGYVAQKFINFSFNYPLNVDEILKTSLNNNEKISEVLKLTNIEEFRYKNFNTLSGGQQQRVFIARAILNNPSLLILDEPFVGIDADSVIKLFSLLKKINENGTTIILITHQEHSIKNYVNKVIVLKNKVFYEGDSANYDSRMCELC
ncbi:MAG: metal ABC transporter ATP-binding protein [Bacilli bacterium]